MNVKNRENAPAVPCKFNKNPHLVKYTDCENREITLYGELYVPQATGKFPAVILSHGFNGHCTDFAAECKCFAEHGYVCYAFEFCGAQANGKSTGRTAADYTPFTMKDDLCAAFSAVKALENVDESQIFLFGGSQGGLVTALAAADETVGNEVAAIAAYYPAFCIPDDWRGKPARHTILMGYSIDAAYIRSVQDLDIFGQLGRFKKDVCIVWGDRDALVKQVYIDKVTEVCGKDRVFLTVLEGAGHGFCGTALQTAVKTVLAFLEAHRSKK